MTKFRVHYLLNDTGATSKVVPAKTPEEAANATRAQYPNAIVTKTKIDRSGE
jgi:hypothetical protein